MKKYLFLALVLVFLVSGCTPAANTNTNTTDRNDNTVTVDRGSDSELDGDSSDVEIPKTDIDIAMVLYENKSVGYTIMRPENWYWRHYIRSQIGDANPTVDDYFFTNRLSSIGELGTEKPASIIIEVSSRPLSDFADSVVDATKRSVTVGGVSATRYESKSGGSIMIQYQFVKDDTTYRLIYSNPAGLDAEEKVYEALVASFKFTS